MPTRDEKSREEFSQHIEKEAKENHHIDVKDNTDKFEKNSTNKRTDRA